MKNKKVFIIFIVVFLATIGYKIKPLFASFGISKDITLNENEKYSIKKTLKRGCYEVGFYSKDKLFYSPMYEPYKFKNSQFKLTLYNKNEKELKKITIDKNSRLQHGFNPNRIMPEISNVALELFKVPLKGSSTIKAVIDVKQLNSKFKNKNIYLYFRKYANSCDMEHLAMVDLKHAYPITKVETNSTLIPLYNALTTKDTKKAKDILEINQTLCDGNFIGDRTVFHYSSFLNDLDTLTYLANKCTTKLINKTDILKKTPVIYATENNSSKTLNFLFEHGGKCPEILENIYVKTYVGGGIVYKKIEFPEFMYYYNLVEIADALAKYKCMDVDKSSYIKQPSWIRKFEMLVDDINDMKKRNDSRWKNTPDYTKLLEVFKKYSKEYNTTKKDK